MADNDLLLSDFDYDSEGDTTAAITNCLHTNQLYISMQDLVPIGHNTRATSGNNATTRDDDDVNQEQQVSSDDSDSDSEHEEQLAASAEGDRADSVLETLDLESVPKFDNWNAASKVFCSPVFKPASEPDPTQQYPADMKP